MGKIGFDAGEEPHVAAAPRRRRRKPKTPVRGATNALKDEEIVDVTPAQLKKFFQQAGGRMCNIMVATNGWVVISRVDEKKPAECFVFTRWRDVSAHVKKTVGAA